MSDTQKIKITELADRMSEIAKDYGEFVNQIIDKKAKAVIKELVIKTKEDAPINADSEGKHYRDQISSKVLKSETDVKSYLWYVNGDKYRLAHLLNDGHALRNGGRAPGDNHITKHAQVAVETYEKEVKEAIQNGS